MSKNNNKSQLYISDKDILLRIYREEISPNLRKFIVAMIFMVISSVATFGQAFLIQPAIDKTMFASAAEQSTSSEIYIIPLLIILVTFFKSASQYAHMLIMRNLEVKITNNLRSKMYENFTKSDISFFSGKSSGGVISNMSVEITNISQLISLLMTGVFLNFFTAIMLFANMLFMDLMLTFYAFFLMPLAFYPIYLISKKIKKLVIKSQRTNERYFSLIDDSLNAIKVVKSYNAEVYEVSRFNKLMEKIYRINKRINKISVFPSPFMEGLIGFGVAFVIFYAGTAINEGNLTTGAFFSFFASLMIAYKPIKAMTGFNTKYHQFISGSKRAYKILDHKPKIINSEKAVNLPEKIIEPIIFNNVSFKYDKSDKVIINNVSLELELGKKYAFVGRSGSGKTTLFNLLLRFYDVSEGEIKIAGHNIKDIKQSSLHEKIAYVGQDIHLFNASIRENIAYNNDKTPLEKIIQAAKFANAHDFIEKLTFGYETNIGLKGGKLSGGQKQRLSIARAILKDSPILLLDEATSALDIESENKIKVGLEKLSEGKTTLIIAHRLSTVINCDKIFVMDNGRIIESGSHKELLDYNGHYKDLYQSGFAE